MKKILDLSSRSVAIGSMLIMAFAFIGCDDDDSWSPSARSNDEPSVESSSSSSGKAGEPAEPAEVSSSSSEKAKSSSSDSNAGSNGASRSSSSEKKTESSSSEKLSEASSSSADKVASSSSVVTLAMPCKTETEDNCEYGTLLDERDNQVYKTVQIGEQTWMAENLNYGTANSYCYNGNSANCTKYGRLYTWAAAMDSAGTWSANGKGCGYNETCSPAYPVRGVCPEGWHLPTQTEWNTLFTAVGGSSVAGKKLKSTSGWNSSGNGTDAFSFSALPAGYRYDDGRYFSEGYRAYFWSSTESYSESAYNLYLGYNYDSAGLNNYIKYRGYSVRCVKD